MVTDMEVVQVMTQTVSLKYCTDFSQEASPGAVFQTKTKTLVANTIYERVNEKYLHMQLNCNTF